VDATLPDTTPPGECAVTSARSAASNAVALALPMRFRDMPLREWNDST
jgi:hypothetical protein